MIPWHLIQPHLAAIAAAPECDTTRLAFADRLEEIAQEQGRENCGRCKLHSGKVIAARRYLQLRFKDCPNCSGSGFVSGVCANWASYIRAAVELERCGHEAGTCQDADCHCMTWGSFCRTILPLIREAVLRGPACKRCGGKGGTENRGGVSYSWVSCFTCRGLKYTGPLARLSADAVTWRRGMPHSATAPLADWWMTSKPCPECAVRTGMACGLCGNSGSVECDEPSAWAVRVAGETTVEECVAGDRPAIHDEVMARYYCLRRGESSRLVRAIMKADPTEWQGKKESVLARTALARAIRAEARAVWERDARDILTGVTPQIES